MNGILVILLLGLTAIGNPQTNRPNFSGTWELTKIKNARKSKTFEKEIRIIEHKDPLLKVTVRTFEGKKEIVSNRIYYTDKRGEKNTIGKDNETVTTTTRLRRKAVLIRNKFEVPLNGTIPKSTIKMTETTKWKLSKDGKTLTETIRIWWVFGNLTNAKRIYSRVD